MGFSTVQSIVSVEEISRSAHSAIIAQHGSRARDDDDDGDVWFSKMPVSGKLRPHDFCRPSSSIERSRRVITCERRPISRFKDMLRDYNFFVVHLCVSTCADIVGQHRVVARCCNTFNLAHANGIPFNFAYSILRRETHKRHQSR